MITQAQLRTIKDWYAKMPNKELARITGCNLRQISNAAHRYNLRKTYDNPGCIKKGATPWNKGKAYTAGGNSEKTRFKKGEAPPNTDPIGTTKVIHGVLYKKPTTSFARPSGSTGAVCTASYGKAYTATHHRGTKSNNNQPTNIGHTL